MSLHIKETKVRHEGDPGCESSHGPGEWNLISERALIQSYACKRGCGRVELDVWGY